MAPSGAMPKPSTSPTAHHRFQILGPLGVGAMCVVHKARDRELGDIVALKHTQTWRPGEHGEQRRHHVGTRPGEPQWFDAPQRLRNRCLSRDARTLPARPERPTLRHECEPAYRSSMSAA